MAKNQTQKISGKKASAKSTDSFPIVGIGSSAGGLEAVSELLTNLSVNTGMAYVYIQHVNPLHETKLPGILSKLTKLKISEAKSGQVLKPDHLYILPANKEMILMDGKFKMLQPKVKHMPVDLFFTSLAEVKKEKAIGIILSGTANDGTIGLKAIKLADGITFAQDDTAKFQSMPKSAIASGSVDLTLSPTDIAKELDRLGKHFSSTSTDLTFDSIKDEDEDLLQIIQILKKETAIDFSHYKMTTIKRRILRRMLLHKKPSLPEYIRYLKKDPSEVSALHSDLLINVTSFFRDRDVEDYLKKTLLPRIIRSKPSTEPIRIWIPACSSGEEVYSMAILLHELLGNKIHKYNIQLFATDLSEYIIAKARLGIYTKNELASLSAMRLQKFFTKVDDSYRVTKSIREMCVFAKHNIFTDPPFSRLDLVSCCNLLIYLDTSLQKQIMNLFHYALIDTGYLVLGKSETVGNSSTLFTQVNGTLKIYIPKKTSVSKKIIEKSFTPGELEKTKNIKTAGEKHKDESTLEKMVDALILSQYVTPSVVVNKDLDIIRFRGSTGLYLESAPGKASFNLLKMARAGLGFELRNAIHKVNKTNATVRKSDIEIEHKNHNHNISFQVIPLTQKKDPYYLIIFDEKVLPPVKDLKSPTIKDRKIKQLEQELSGVREDMRAIMEESETAYEELQSANEEILSSNEELQSINEELERSKEELQSTNEELLTANAELKTLNKQVAEQQEYTNAIITTMRESFLILSKDLRIKSANDSFYSRFHLNEKETEGLLIYDIGNKAWDFPRLHEFFQKIVPRNSSYKGFEITHEFENIGEKILLLNFRNIKLQVHNEDLILLTIEDITEQKKSVQLSAQREWFKNMADNAPVMIWVDDTDKNFSFLNNTMLEYTGRKLADMVENGWSDSIHPSDIAGVIKKHNKAFDNKESFSIEYRVKRYDGKYRWILNTGKPTFTCANEFTGYIGTCVEIHHQKKLKQELEESVSQRTAELQKANTNLEHSNKELQQFAYVASHDLQEPLRKIITFSNLLNESFRTSLPTKGQAYITKIISSSKRMSQLIEDLLNFSRVSKSGTNFSNTDLNIILNEVLSDFELTLNQKHAKIITSTLPVIQAIPVQMTQLFHNLVSNALKFSHKDPKTPTITISSKELTAEEAGSFKELEKDKTYIEIILKDNGIGFKQEFAEQIFIIFQRLHGVKEYSGTGIGLALCKRIVENHKGLIFAESKENEGACFHIILPA